VRIKDGVSATVVNMNVDGEFLIANAWGAAGQSFADTRDPKYLAIPVDDQSSTRSALNVKGAIAVAVCNPTNQVAKTAASVGELLQDVPAIPGLALWKSRLRALETVAASADEFLNVTFGILPTIADMQDFLKGVHKVDKAVDQFIRDSGRQVRRSYHFDTERTETETVVTGASPIGYANKSNNLYPTPSRCLPSYETIRHRVVERKIWFDGAFTYYLPDWYETGNRQNRIKLTAKLLGADVDLNTVWQLAPWSWAVDWFSNAGTFVKAVQSLISYGTIMRYGYVMETTTVTDTYKAGNMIAPYFDASYSGFVNPPYPAIAPVTIRVTTKKRVKANPFGFGVSWDGLSTVQQAIVAALGITRVVR